MNAGKKQDIDAVKKTAKKSLLKRAWAIEKLMKGIATEHNAEHLHQLRIAVRRFRFGMEIFKAYFKKNRYAEVLERLARLQDCTGRLRDADVFEKYLVGSDEDVSVHLRRLQELRRFYYKKLAFIIDTYFNNNYLSHFISRNL